MLFVAKKNVGNSLRRSCQLDDDSEAVNLSQDANIVREDMLRRKMYHSAVHSQKIVMNIQYLNRWLCSLQ